MRKWSTNVYLFCYLRFSIVSNSFQRLCLKLFDHAIICSFWLMQSSPCLLTPCACLILEIRTRRHYLPLHHKRRVGIFSYIREANCGKWRKEIAHYSIHMIKRTRWSWCLMSSTPGFDCAVCMLKQMRKGGGWEVCGLWQFPKSE